VIEGYTANPYYVVPVEDHVVTRYLLVFNSSNGHQHNVARQLTLPQTRYSTFMNQGAVKEAGKEETKKRRGKK
jgi:hypothetical protein